MFKWLDSLSYPVLSSLAVLILLAPFKPMPHVWEKLLMLKSGQLTRPIDMFDLLFHLAPIFLLVFKAFRDTSRKRVGR